MASCKNDSHRCASSHRFRDINLSKHFYIENCLQGHGVQHAQWDQSMANVKLYKYCITYSPNRFCEFTVKIDDLENIGQGLGIHHSQWRN